METAELNSTNRDKIRSAIGQILISYLAMGIILTLVVAAAVIFIHLQDFDQSSKTSISTAILIVSVGGFSAFLYNSIKNHLDDLQSGLKNRYYGVITDKSSNTNWGWHGNAGVDFTSKPKLVELYIMIDEWKIYVDESNYKQLNVGDSIKVDIAPNSNILLGINKNIKHQVTTE